MRLDLILKPALAEKDDMWKVEAFPKLGMKITKYEGQYISLLTPEEFERLPNGTVVISIFGNERIKGVDELSMDTRFGRLAFGVQDD